MFSHFWQVAFSDESSFECRTASSHSVWHTPESHQPTLPHIPHPIKVMIWGMFSFWGTGRLHVCEGNMNSQQYLHVLRTGMKPQLDEWYREGGIFMQDNAPCHTARVVKQYLDEAGIQILDWPGNSPDLNPIENLWAMLKERMKKHSLTTKQQLISKLQHYWVHDEGIQNSLRNLIESMPRRLEAVIAVKGGNTKY